MKAFKSTYWLSILILLTFVVTAAPTPSPQPGWVIETVDAPKLFNAFTPNMLKLYNNQPRVAYGGDHLYYASSDDGGGNWTLETIDPSSGVGGNASLVLDTSGNPYIGYFDHRQRELKFAGKDPNNSSQWYYETVDPGSSGDFLAIALDTSGQPHIAYFAASALRHAWRSCSGSAPSVVCTWTIEYILSAVNPNNISLAIDTTDKIHISYYGGTTGKLEYVTRVADATGTCGPGPNNYRCDIVDSGTNPGSSGTSIALYADQPRIAYGIYGIGTKFAYYDGSSWHTADADPNYGGTPALVLTSTGLPHIVFSALSGVVKLASGSTTIGGTWTYSDVTGSTDAAGSAAAINSTGDVCEVYYQNYTGNMNYSCQSSGVWLTLVAFDHANDVGTHSSLALDGSGKPHISYYDASLRNPKYAVRGSPTPGGCGTAGGPWKCEVVNNTTGGAGTGQYTSMAINPAGGPAFSFLDTSVNNYLDFAKFVGTGGNCPGNSAWDCESVDSNLNWVGLSTSLAYGPGPGYIPRIAYFDISSHSLKLATYTGSDGNCPGNPKWYCEIVDAGQGNYANYSHLALRSDGKAVISYFNSTTKAIKLAFEVTSGATGCSSPDNPAIWKCITIDSPIGDYDAQNSLALLSDTEARISYFDSHTSMYVLKYASVTLPAGTSSYETVDNSTYAGQYNSLAIFSSTPMIAYYVANGDTDKLRFARWVGSDGNCPGNTNWQCEVIEPVGNVGQYVSLKVNQYGTPYLTYYDAENGDLKMAHLGFQAFLPLTQKP